MEDFNPAEFEALQQLIPKLIADATVVEAPPRPEYKDREKLKTGRIYLPNFVQSFEVC